MILENMAGPLIFLGSMILMFLLAPVTRIKEHLLTGLIGGLGIGFLLIFIMQNMLGLWSFSNIDILYINNIPILLAVAWLPAIILFSHLLSQYKEFVLLALLIIAFPAAATFLHLLFIENGMLNYFNWNLLYTFLVSLAIHLGILTYLYAAGKLENFREIGDFR